LSLCDGPTSRGWAQLDLARLLRLNRRYSRALEHATEAAQALPREALAWTELGSCQAALGLREAAESFRRALELQPDSLPARSGLKSLQRRGWAAGLRAFFRRILGR
jgi:tetratricopeptide (TPR) repeat protein